MENIKFELSRREVCNSGNECYNFTQNIDGICDECKKTINTIQIGFFIFDRGWIETKIIQISNDIEHLSNCNFFNGKFKRLSFNRINQAFETGLINLKKFENLEEKELAEIVIGVLKNTNSFSEDFVKFEITIPSQFSYYFKELN